MILGHLEQKLCSKCQNPYSAVPSYSAVHTPAQLTILLKISQVWSIIEILLFSQEREDSEAQTLSGLFGNIFASFGSKYKIWPAVRYSVADRVIKKSYSLSNENYLASSTVMVAVLILHNPFLSRRSSVYISEDVLAAILRSHHLLICRTFFFVVVSFSFSFVVLQFFTRHIYLVNRALVNIPCACGTNTNVLEHIARCHGLPI